MHRDGRSQGCQYKQSIEQHRNHITDNRHVTESLLEYVWQGNEDERRTAVWLHTYREGCREDHQTCQYGDYRINGHNLSSRLQEIGLSVEVRGISTQTCRTHTQREERLSQRFEQHVFIYLREIRLQQKLHSFHRSRQRAGSYHNHNQQEEEHRHQYLGCFLYTIAHTAYYHHVGKQDKTYCP